MIQRYEKTGFDREFSVAVTPFMKKCVFFAATVLFAALSAGTAGAQSRVATIDKVTVSATRVPVALHSSARIVTLMDSLTIASAPAETVNDLLKYALGVDVRQRGAMGMQTDISIRGGTYNQYHRAPDGAQFFRFSREPLRHRAHRSP